MKCILELSGEHPDLPREEIAAIGKVTGHRTQVAVAEIAHPEQVSRLAYTHVAMQYLGECDADEAAFSILLDDLAIESDKPFCARVRKMADSGLDASTTFLERMIGSRIRGPVSVSAPERVYRAVVSGGRIFFGEVFFTLDRDPYHERKPGNRAFFHPGVMMPRMVRALVNLSGAAPASTVLDPFCGTGGTLIEAGMIGCRAVGTDADPLMVAGTCQNLPGAYVAVADVRHLPFPDGSIDHVVSDLPYGQSVFIIGSGLDLLYRDALAEIRRVIRPGKRSVIVTHRDIRPLVGEFFTITGYYEQRVHRSLTRRILVVTRPDRPAT